jgi:hypothetical protein
MNLLRKSPFFFLSVTILTGCASIVSKSSWPITVDSNPSGANVSITNKVGKEVYQGKTPASMKLKSGSGFFGKESYTVAYSLNGYESKKVTVDCKVNGWYFGNLLIGGVIGMLIVDPATGAMYKLDSEEVTQNLIKINTTSSVTPSLNILDKNKLTEEQQKHLVKLN